MIYEKINRSDPDRRLVALKLPLEHYFMAIGVAGVIGAVAVTLLNHKLLGGDASF